MISDDDLSDIYDIRFKAYPDNGPFLGYMVIQERDWRWTLGHNLKVAGGLEYARQVGREEGNPMAVNDAYQQGRMAGWDEGYEVGYEIGLDVGRDEGQS